MERKIDSKLLSWKNDANRLPLILDGARQVGKTYALTRFAKEHYKNCVHVNMDINRRVAAAFEQDIAPSSILRILEAEAQQQIRPGGTLVILDEIQASGRALTSLKYFAEDAPEYHVAAAGSLLGVAVNRERYSFPVGKVKTLHMYPLDFEEYLSARGEALLAGEIKRCFASMEPLAEPLHDRAIDHYREYLIVGGMPACVKRRADGASLLEIPPIQNEIMDNYIADMAKYASASDAVKIRSCYNSLPAQLGKDNKKFQYKIVRKGGTASIFGASIEWLALAGVVLRCGRIDHGYIPVSAYADHSAFKLYFSDVGLLAMKTDIPHSLILSGEANTLMGALTENYVAQQLAAAEHELWYWTSEGIAELDFVTQSQEGVSGIEVKKGEHTKSKGLGIFSSKYQPARRIRLSLKNFGDTDGLLAIPLYAAFCL
jgi:predicted AAA+ superfamily ATPase